MRIGFNRHRVSYVLLGVRESWIQFIGRALWRIDRDYPLAKGRRIVPVKLVALLPNAQVQNLAITLQNVISEFLKGVGSYWPLARWLAASALLWF